MKRILGVVLLGACALAGCTTINPKADQAAATAQGRQEIPLTDHWTFLKADPLFAERPAVPHTTWQPISLPHTWNSLDGQDGGFDTKANYLRTACWYHLHLQFTPAMAGKALVLKFDGANRRADVFVNGTKVAKHIGGFAAFTADITSAMHPGDNLLAVRVSNEYDDDSPPLSADFTFFGGLYRPVSLLLLDPVHISPLDTGSCGITIRTPVITDAAATVRVHTLIQNTDPAAHQIHLRTTITDAQGTTVQSDDQSLDLPSAATQPADAVLTLNNPHRWNGRKDPYLYRVTVDVFRDGKVVDQVTQPLGLRTFSVDKDKGFILNGQPYHLHGVDRHQDRPDKGWAISNADHDEDMALIKEMGCTAIRLAHYQHAQHFYDLCDKEGIVVWAEVPVVNAITPDKEFAANAKQQLTELIRQNINHPAICFWSLENEVSASHGDPAPLFKEMNALAHKEDPSRLTTMAFAVDSKDMTREWPGISDVIGKNRYSGWYRGELSDFPTFLDTQGPLAISEYGAGASIYFHSEHPTRMDHTEEYQCIFHENYWPAMQQRPKVWGTFAWNMFDFAADQRHEGDHAGRNDKGLVTYDRKTRKDVFFYYKANWSDDPVVHINSKRFTTRGQSDIVVKVYANTTDVELLVNGHSLGKATGTYCVYTWPHVPLQPGENHITARGTRDGQPIEDTCTWTYQPGAPTEVYIAQDETMREELKKGPPRPTPDPAAATTQKAP